MYTWYVLRFNVGVCWQGNKEHFRKKIRDNPEDLRIRIYYHIRGVAAVKFPLEARENYKSFKE